jgi:hypothetical protein
MFSALSEAMKIYPYVELKQLLRMADFSKWGYAISEALGYGGDTFIDALQVNESRKNEETIIANPIAAAVKDFMSSRNKWEGTITTLLDRLSTVAVQLKLDTRTGSWPKASNALSRRLREIKSDLEFIGIAYEFGRMIPIIMRL